MPCHTKCCTWHTKSSCQNWRSDAPKCNPIRKSAPGLNRSLVLRLPRKMHLCSSRSNVPRLPSLLEMLQNPHVLLTFDEVHYYPLRLPHETISDRPKVLLTTLPVSLLHFWLGHVLRATKAYTFSTAHFLKVLGSWGSLCVLTSTCAWCYNSVRFFQHLNFQRCSGIDVLLGTLTWKCASRHNCLQFLISHPPTRCQTAPQSPLPQISGKTEWFASTLSRTCIFFILLSSDSFSSLIFSLLLFSDSSHLCFSICPYCPKFDF